VPIERIKPGEWYGSCVSPNDGWCVMLKMVISSLL
jgi:hypothetical protein